MLITLLLSVMMMVGLFLMLLSGVGFLQDKKFFSSAPKEVRDVVPETKPVLGRYQFGYNWKTHLLHVIVFIPSVALLSWICTLL